MNKKRTKKKKNRRKYERTQNEENLKWLYARKLD